MNGRIRQRIEDFFAVPVRRQERLSGGCLGTLSLLTLQDGRRIVLKQGAGLECEAFMLRYLRAQTALPLPDIYLAGPAFIVLQYLPGRPGPDGPKAERHLAELVAGLHDISAPAFGFARDTVIGPLRQPNGEAEDWPSFFRDRRLCHMAGEARAAGRLPPEVYARLMAFSETLEKYLDHAPRPALLHGDLWGGNILAENGRITGLIDPALYYGDAEIELAFLTLFGTVGPAFFDAYGALRPLEREFFECRREIYLLYPLLVHVRLFGGAYVGQLEAILDRFL